MKPLFALIALLLAFSNFLLAGEKENKEFEKLIAGKTRVEIHSLLYYSLFKKLPDKKFLLQAKTYFESSTADSSKIYLGLTLQSLARMYWLTGKFDSSFVYYDKAEKVFQTIQEPLQTFDNYIHLGLIYFAVKDYKKAESYYFEAGKYLDNITPWQLQKHRTAVQNWNLANVNIKIGNYEKARQHLNIAFQKIGEIDTLTSTYSLTNSYVLATFYMGNLETSLRNYDSAITFYQRSIEYAYNNHDTYLVTNSLAQIGISFNALKQYDSTVKYCSASLALADSNRNTEYKPVALEQLAIAFYAKGQFQKAFDFYQRFKIANDSVNNYDRKIAAFINQKAEREKQDIELRKNEMELKQNYMFAIAFIIIAFLLVIAYIIYSRYKLTNKLNQQLNESNATKDKLFSVISHDLKGPLSAFTSLFNALNDKTMNFSELTKRDLMNNMHKSSINILHLLDNLLSWSRVQMKHFTVYFEEFGLYFLAEVVIHTLEDIAMLKDIVIINSIDQSLSITADRNALEVVVRNLISNAIKFSEIGGQIEIESIQRNGEIEISVHDHGIGIDEESKKKLFQFSGNKSKLGTFQEQGTGLGLVICKEIVELHGGKIWAEANSPTGTIFKFSLTE